jgi:pimeloyl-ACP methyl ester carboxylesterase
MEITTIFKKFVASLLTLSFGFVISVAVCTSTAVQRQLFYLHKAPIWWRQKLDKPESFGFLHNQILSFRISTSDSKRLCAWLVTPLALYARHERELVRCSQDGEQHRDIAVGLLSDPESRLVIYFHGNAGSVGQTRRTDAYRMVASGDSKRTFVLAFDYRGFGRSSGYPTEAGLIDDAESVIRWATTVGKVPTKRIVLLAQSLGTAVATAAVDALVHDDPGTEFSGLILCAAFPDAASVMMSYRIGGYLPLLSPLAAFRPARTWFASRIRDNWDTKSRLGRIVNASKHLRLTFLAAECDEVIPYGNTEDLFRVTVQRAIGSQTLPNQVDNHCEHFDLGEGGSVQRWTQDGKSVKKVLVRYGGRWITDPISMSSNETLLHC